MRAIRLAFPVGNEAIEGDLDEHLADLREKMRVWEAEALQSDHEIQLELDRDRKLVILKGEMWDLADAVMTKVTWA